MEEKTSNSCLNASIKSSASTASCISFGPEDFLEEEVIVDAADVPPPIKIRKTSTDRNLIKTEEGQSIQAKIEATPGPSTSTQATVQVRSNPWLEKKTKKKESRKRQVEQEDMGSADEEEEIGVADTFTEYKPVKWTIGKPHPDPVVETATLSAIASLDIHYKVSIGLKAVDSGALSNLQLEAIAYCGQVHEKTLPDGSRAGFLIGDGAGVGKGRTIAGVMLDNFHKGRKKAVWVSVSADLKHDAERDFEDIGAGAIRVMSVTDTQYKKIPMDKGVIFSTYAALIGVSKKSSKTRIEQIVKWCGPGFDGVIVFDECHKAKNLRASGKIDTDRPDDMPDEKATKTGIAVFELQRRLPQARVVYASATGASEPRHMSYMTRLGLWGEDTPFRDFSHLWEAVNNRGVGVMEIVACDMKLRGMYLARQLSFHGVTFRIEEAAISADLRHTYDASVKLWVEALAMFEECADLTGMGSKARRTVFGQFWGAHQRFFKYLCIAAKVDETVKIAKRALAENKCVVIGLQSTGEARMREAVSMDENLARIISTTKAVFQSMVTKFFPKPVVNKRKASGAVSSDRTSKRRRIMNSFYDEEGDGYGSSVDEEDSWKDTDSDAYSEIGDDPFDYESQMIDSISTSPTSNLSPHQIIAKIHETKERLLRKIDYLGDQLPPNTLDFLIDKLGGTGEVAEMTGRKKRMIRSVLGERFVYSSRALDDIAVANVNLDEKEKFMSGKKLVAIISEAASSGVSLQSDRRVANQRRRVHITLELPWSADKAIQQFGRTHRSNQVNAPEYVLLISDLAGERRFAATVAKRLEALGALTHGDRRATETRDLSGFNIENKYGIKALKIVLKSIYGLEESIVPLPAYEGEFFADVTEALHNVGLAADNDKSIKISKFLNRILGVPVGLQNKLFQFFSDTLAEVERQAKKDGKYDIGIRDLGMGGVEVSYVSGRKFNRRHATGETQIDLHTVHVERGMAWEEAIEKLKGATDPAEGFYITNVRNTIYLGRYNDQGKLQVYRPNLGLEMKNFAMWELKDGRRKVDPGFAHRFWQEQYDFSLNNCLHSFNARKCRFDLVDCEYGRRKRTYHILSGAVLAVWPKVARILKDDKDNTRMIVVRVVITNDGRKLIGALIPKEHFDDVVKMLEVGESEMYAEEEML